MLRVREKEESAERQWRERERQQRLDRERILLESAAAADAAVNQHFHESLRLASQKVGGATCPGQAAPHVAVRHRNVSSADLSRLNVQICYILSLF